ncbi:uncharacterized protein TNCT_603051 [Trichonephila clavata]|uniref:Uncharacterized protein n=1 Tax=Trichonephila clavata TaxID=2740835 RepID=A0A8X6L1Q0_TRICU|nr:uncharacterized protein TNCT_603051 [Trichonephila clavata]
MSLLPINFITQFLEEALSSVLAYNNLNWEPPIRLSEDPFTTTMISRSIATALNHYCMEEYFSRNEPEWVYLSGTEAEMYIHHYLREYMNTVQIEDRYTYFYFISLICQLCVSVIRRGRSEIVRFVIAEAVNILRSRCDATHFVYFNRLAVDYNFYHRAKHAESEDDGFGTDAED